jgi:phospholipase C
MTFSTALRTAALAGIPLVCAGCASHAGSAPSGPVLPPALAGSGAHQVRAFGPSPAQGKIKHVVIVMEENRSFNYLFEGYPGAMTASHGRNSHGEDVKLAAVSLAAPYEIDHELRSFLEACDGKPPGQNCKMDGFDKEYVGGSYGANPEYAYAPHAETRLYWRMAKEYVLGDDMHTSHIDASFVSHQYIIAGQAASEVNLPTSYWGCEGGVSGDSVETITQERKIGPSQNPCQNYQTLGDELDAAGLPWRFYAAPISDIGYIWSAYQAVKHIYDGKDWKNDVITPPARFLSDVGAGTLGAVTWVLPTWDTSDHPGNGSTSGPQWVASVVNAVGESTFWDSTAVFVFWDEWGGWFDPGPPPYEDYDGLGFRVGLLVISPYAKKNYVSHVQYEHGSMLRFAEDAFGLGQLSASDARANDPAVDCFDFSQKPRAFRPFATGLPPHYFERLPVSHHVVDEE